MARRPDPRLAGIPRSVNDQIADRSIRHMLLLTRLQNREARDMLELLDTSVISDVLDQLDRRLARIAERGFDTGPVTTRRLQELAVALNSIAERFAGQATAATRERLFALAQTELEFEARLIEQTIPVEWELNLPDPGQLREIINLRPVEGTPLRDFWTELGQETRRNVMRDVRTGLVEGETPRQLASRLRNGSLQTAKNHTESIAHTLVNFTANQTRMALYEENDDLVKGWKWVATLDSRTCLTCAELDGEDFTADDNQQPPPAHFNCRCTTVPVLKSFEELGIAARDLPPGTRASMDGQVPADLTYGDWLKRQPAAVQNEALGPTRARAFRRGDVDVGDFVNRRGRVLTLDELRQREGDIFG